VTGRRELLREHWPLLAVLGVAVVARAVIAIAYRPALFFSDSWSYINLAYSGERFAPDRPSGYSLLLELIGLPGHSLAVVTTLQHMAGIAVGLLVYALLVRAGTGRAIATVGAALVALNAYAIVLEQTILAEAFFTLALVASFYLVVGGRRSPIALGAAGVLLSSAVMMRSAALFAVPVWLLYVFYRCRLRGLIALAAVVLPLLTYALVHDASTGKFGLTSADGWFLYGRVGEIADCRIVHPPADTRDLCEPPSNARGLGPLYYIWNPDSAANRRFSKGFATPGSSDLLNRFATSVIEARPGAYAGLVVRDTLRYFAPGVASPGRSDAAITLLSYPRLGPPWLNTTVRDRLLPGFQPEVHAPSSLARAYAAVVRIPRPLLGIAILLSLCLVPIALRAPPGARPPHTPEALVLSLSTMAMLVGPVATSGFIVRYLVPTVPLIVCAGALAVHDLRSWAVARRSRRRPAMAAA
jgi:dolichyl-phosphate-mannose-protein mannosyltransferase